MTTKILHGIRVLDLGRFIAVPYCGMVLADMGAEVIRIERPGGEEDRRTGLKAANGENFTYPGLARNKKGITLNIQKNEGREILLNLTKCADVVLHSFSPTATKAMRLTYDDIRAIKENIIYGAVSCYGPDGPYASRTGLDPIAQVMSGAASLNGFADQVPLRSAVPWADYSTGLFCAIGVLLALRHRDATGQGQRVECSLLQTAVSYTAPMIAEAVVTGRERPRLGNRAPYRGPNNLFKCRDGYVFVATTETMWGPLMTLVGRPDLAEAAWLRADEERFEFRNEVDPVVERWIELRTVDEAVSQLNNARIPCGICYTTSQVSSDPQVQALRMLEYVNFSFPGLEHVPVSGVPITLSKCPGEVVSRAPTVGEHNREVYKSLLHYEDSRLEELTVKRII